MMRFLAGDFFAVFFEALLAIFFVVDLRATLRTAFLVRFLETWRFPVVAFFVIFFAAFFVTFLWAEALRLVTFFLVIFFVVFFEAEVRDDFLFDFFLAMGIRGIPLSFSWKQCVFVRMKPLSMRSETNAERLAKFDSKCRTTTLLWRTMLAKVWCSA